MAQSARKLSSETKLRIVNCDLGHSLFMAEGRIKFFCGCDEKTRLSWALSVREIHAFGPQTRKNVFLDKNNFILDFATVDVTKFNVQKYCFIT